QAMRRPCARFTGATLRRLRPLSPGGPPISARISRIFSRPDALRGAFQPLARAHKASRARAMAEPLALYVHWPFCVSKCPYCDFNSHVRDRVDQDVWRAALLADLRHEAALLGERRVSSIFFGGGTPSLMPPSTVAAVIAEAEAL